MPPDSLRDSRTGVPTRLPSAAPPGGPGLGQWLLEELFVAPLVPVLHPTTLRMKGLGLFMLLGHPLFWLVWTFVQPQAYESLPLRIVACALGLLLIDPRVSADPSGPYAGRVSMAVLWFEIPFFTSWMYLCNGGGTVWLAVAAAMVLVYYAVTDWRIASAGLVAGFTAAWMVGELFSLAPPMDDAALQGGAIVLGFCVGMGILLGLSSANLRREQLAHTLSTISIMAHELRTPLATMALIGDAVRGSAGDCDEATGRKLELLAGRLHTLVRSMNHQVDMQISNARLLRLPRRGETLSAANLVRQAVSSFPFRSTRERDAVVLDVRQDFQFRAAQTAFQQVIDNLVKNALQSLAATGRASQPGDLTIAVSRADNRGRIVVSDRGGGIAPEVQPRIFEPFFSTNRGMGHGLGLAFSRRVVQAAGGTIRVRSEPGSGATFIIELPVSG